MNFGIIGTNFISDWFVKASRKFNQISLSSVYSRTNESGSAFAEKHRIPRVITNFDTFINDPALDCIYIASPNCLHCAHAIKAMTAGKHVLCEKPAATSLSEYNEIVKTAHKNKVIFLEAIRSIFDPAYEALAKQLPQIGTLRRIRFEYCQYSSRYDKYKEGTILNAFRPELGNAALLDLGVYCIHTLVYLFGKPKALTSVSTFLPNGMQGSGSILLEYDQMIGEITYSKITSSLHHSIIQGESGSITIDQISAPREITLHPRNGSPITLYQNDTTENMHHEIATFLELVEKTPTPQASRHKYLTYTQQTMEIIEEIKRQNQIKLEASPSE